jgi:hypothetical protein
MSDWHPIVIVDVKTTKKSIRIMMADYLRD